jgi:hypothetical protein
MIAGYVPASDRAVLATFSGLAVLPHTGWAYL